MIFGYKNDKYLGCSTDTETLEKALKMAGIDTEGMETSDKAPEPPTHEPTTEEKIAAFDADYNQQKQALINEYTDAQIHGDTDTIALVQHEMTELDEWYDEEYRKIEEENEEGE